MRRITFCLTLLLSASKSFGWNKAGHMIVGAIAYDVLEKTHPEIVQKFITLMHSHPQWDVFDKRIHADTIPESDRDRYLFMVAARWPDDVRTEPGGYSHAPWHYIDFPIVFPADRGKVTPAPPDKENALTAIDAQTKTVKNGSDPQRQAIALCWIEHLVGDIHQPLHFCSMYSAQFPEGDRGGNSQGIKVNSDRATIELHALWDGLMTSSELYKTDVKIAAELESRPESARTKLVGVDDAKPYDWAWESYSNAVHTAYLDGAIKATVYKRGDVDKDSPALPDGYPQAAKAVAERRIILAGYRLADQLVLDLGG